LEFNIVSHKIKFFSKFLSFYYPKDSNFSNYSNDFNNNYNQYFDKRVNNLNY